MTGLHDMITQAAAELRDAALQVDPVQLTDLAEEITLANQVVCYGLGREGLMMRALAMRLYHLGVQVQMAFDMSCPPVSSGDLFVVSCGPGELETAKALVQIAKAAGARVACITAQPQGSVPKASDIVLVLPAQTMANDQAEVQAVLPMGSVFEGAMFVVFEMLVLILRDRLGQTTEQMRARHTNLE